MANGRAWGIPPPILARRNTTINSRVWGPCWRHGRSISGSHAESRRTLSSRIQASAGAIGKHEMPAPGSTGVNTFLKNPIDTGISLSSRLSLEDDHVACLCAIDYLRRHLSILDAPHSAGYLTAFGRPTPRSPPIRIRTSVLYSQGEPAIHRRTSAHVRFRAPPIN